MQPSDNAAKIDNVNETQHVPIPVANPVGNSIHLVSESIQPPENGPVVKDEAEICSKVEPKAKPSIYGSFGLAGSEFALPVSVVQEVVNEPATYTAVPLSPEYLLGLFNLRGNIVPVIDLSKIFNVNQSSTHQPDDEIMFDSRKVAILEFDNLCLGLLFDSTGEVFNNTEFETCLFERSASSLQDQVIAGVFKLDNGCRIIQLLDVHGMLQLDRIPQSLHNGGISAASQSRGKRRQCISFDVGDSGCALDIGAIKEIVNIGKIDNTALAGSLCLGAIDLRGNTVPVVNFSMLLGYQDASTLEIHESDSHRIIVMKVGDNLFGLLVNRINNIVSYFDDELQVFPVLGDKKTAIFKGYIAGKSTTDGTIVLDQSEIFSNEEISAITKGHSTLFKDTKDPSFTEKEGSLNRKTLITFSLDNLYGLEIGDVKEVIDYPPDLIETPTMAKQVRGMFNLRGELVVIIDTRHLYELETFTDYKNTKILVFEAQNTKYGLMVDTVDSILTFSQSDTVEVPNSVFSAKSGVINNDVKQAVMIKSGNTKQTVCVLNLESIARRATSDQQA